jgi:signal transduction histidine kinase
MPRPDFSQPDSPEWPRYFRKRQVPPWWPENEPWPPKRRHWRRMGGHFPFFRRLGCLFAAFSLLGIPVFISVVVFVVNGLGIIHLQGQFFHGLLPFAAIFLGLTIVMVVLAGANLRRMSVHLDDLLAASNRVAEGDYSIQVDEKGPPEVLSLTKAFNSMTSRLQVNDQQRRALLADVSHELRTPLTIIQGNLEGVLDGMYSADEPRLKSILEETKVLSRLIDDLRTLTLAESGTLNLRRELTDLKELVRETVAGYQSQSDATGVNIELSMPDGEILMNVDPERIRQVLSNLMTNAFRYSPKNGVVTISLAESLTTSGKQRLISITDNGPGIAKEDIRHIFDRFYKSSDSHGMGLGLSIAKYIVEAHGGEIKASSEADHGTTISFSLPY